MRIWGILLFLCLYIFSSFCVVLFFFQYAAASQNRLYLFASNYYKNWHNNILFWVACDIDIYYYFYFFLCYVIIFVPYLMLKLIIFQCHCNDIIYYS